MIAVVFLFLYLTAAVASHTESSLQAGQQQQQSRLETSCDVTAEEPQQHIALVQRLASRLVIDSANDSESSTNSSTPAPVLTGSSNLSALPTKDQAAPAGYRTHGLGICSATDPYPVKSTMQECKATCDAHGDKCPGFSLKLEGNIAFCRVPAAGVSPKAFDSKHSWTENYTCFVKEGVDVTEEQSKTGEHNESTTSAQQVDNKSTTSAQQEHDKSITGIYIESNSMEVIPVVQNKTRANPTKHGLPNMQEAA
jgi:hypothetical protein